LPRYTGDRCEQTIDICEYERPCRSGVCHSINGTDEYECKNCNPGFTGKQCETMIDFCKLYPCQNSGVCLTKPNDYYCKCTENYFGKNCEQKIEIECLKHNCQHNSVCHPIKPTGRHLIGGYKCECDKHYEGLYCEKKVDLCKNKTCSYGYCLDGVCQCDPRFPYCKENSNCKNIQCGKGGTCIDVIVGDNTVSKCLCPPGITVSFAKKKDCFKN
jgi:Notch-like protein